MVKIEHGNHHIICWSGVINDTKLRLDTNKDGKQIPTLYFHSAMTFNTNWENIYCCSTMDNYQVCFFVIVIQFLFSTNNK